VPWYTGNGRGYVATLSSVCAGRVQWYTVHRTQCIAYIQIHVADWWRYGNFWAILYFDRS